MSSSKKPELKAQRVSLMFKTKQIEFWQGDFGDAYTARNLIDPATRLNLFDDLIDHPPHSVLEVGSNRGHNLEAISLLFPTAKLFAVEPNRLAANEIPPKVKTFVGPIQDYFPECKFDLVFTCGMLIHVAPQDLELVCAKIADLSSDRVLIIEYFDKDQKSVEYRGHKDQLFVCDFGKKFESYTDWKLLSHGEVMLTSVLNWWVFSKD